MSSMPPNMPPNMPPGGGAPPPYDPQTQWRTHREQQKAAWRAQRDAWRAQRHAWKANYVGMYGPRVPSMVGPIILVSVGVIALLVISGHLDTGTFWEWYGRWWPLLLIGAGLALLGEWALDMRRETPVRRSGGFIGILIFLAFLGAISAAHNHFWGPNHFDFGDDGFFSNFGLPEHDSDQPVDNRQIPANASIEIRVPRGDVSITASDQQNLEVHAQEVAYANSDSGAKKIFDAEAAHVTVNGSAVLIQSQNNNRGRVNLSIAVPKTAHVTVNAGWDSVTASGLGSGIDITARGDIHLSSITGPVMAHFVNGKHDVFAAQDVQGDVTLEGNVNDITLSNIKGGISQNGDIPGDVSMENVAGMASTENIFAMGPSNPPSRYWNHVISFLATKSFHFDASLSRLTLSTTKGCPANFCAILRICGSASRQGPHQVAQKSMSTTLPASLSMLMCWPSRVVNVKAGAIRERASSRRFRKRAALASAASSFLSPSRKARNSPRAASS